MSRDIMSDVIVHNKYAKYNGTRRETWVEICTRSAEMFAKKYPAYEKQIYGAFANYVVPKKVMPSMRCLQFAGKPVELSPNRLFNCSFLAMDHYKAFSETMFLLLGGSGVGFSVQDIHISKLPHICPPLEEARYVVQDSITGWADAINYLMKAYFTGKPRPVFNFDDIRDKGMPLVTSGGKAPGAEPLKECLGSLEKILKTKAYGERVTSVEVFDMQCYIAMAVLAGGIRRAATICLFDAEDDEMIQAKYGEWYVKNPQRSMANISAIIDKRESPAEQWRKFSKIYDILTDAGSGEPGFIFSNDPNLGFNPCVEASLPPMGLCNLTTTNVGDNPSNVELMNRVVTAAFLGTLQAGFTEFYYLRKGWEDQAKADPLLGVSLTGIGSYKNEELYKKNWFELGELVKSTNDKWAKRIGINPASKTTCIKPEGTSSLVMGTSSGVGAWHAPYYIRRLQLNKGEPLYNYLKKEIPELIEDHHMHKNMAVVSMGVKAPEGGQFRSETALDSFDRVVKMNKSWVAGGHRTGVNPHNVSCTINVKPDEWKTLKKKIFDDRDSISGISMIPYDVGTYQQPPFEDCTKEKYEELSVYLKDIDLSKVLETEDLTDLKGEVACGGGGCEVK